ncbi:MAG: hypothetical protein A2V62_04900 [Nitrospirae bacterium RBG_19FT_COMBO_58_9]|nr:MAG: hypothetical protein A2V62_04900 [Nitrospirae bacterium RBG_19FT_COMBO_58_9]
MGAEPLQTLVIIQAAIGSAVVFDEVMNLVTSLDGSSGDISGVWQNKVSVQCSECSMCGNTMMTLHLNLT